MTQSDEWAALLTTLHAQQATVVGFDLGLQSALMLALRHPAQVNKLVLTEALAGRLPGAETFLNAGPPWWFGFHSASGLAEEVLVGHEGEYLNWFYENSTTQKLSEQSRAEYTCAYVGKEALRGGFEHYRAFAEDAQQLNDVFGTARLRQPTLIIGGGIVKDAPYKQLAPVSDDIRFSRLEDCGHVTPQEQPAAFLTALLHFLEGGR